MNASYEKKIGELTNKLESLSKSCKRAYFVQIKNKWIDVIDDSCCANECLDKINTPNASCIKGNGFVKLIDDENIKYINCIEGKGFNKYVRVYTENQVNKPNEDFTNYSLNYFEIKCKIEGEKNGYKNWINILLKNCNKQEIGLIAEDGIIKNEEDEAFKLDNFSWNDGDVFGCGIVYPPTEINELPYIFFTQNGKQIGKAILLNDNFEFYKPYVLLRCCSIEANFGNDLETKPFCYDIKQHFVIKEFYVDSDVD
uniref:SPRY domain-containing protein n=1 Tax=Meloidogyne hapla TaxID=6305 RepID=A0A1I8BJQ8_MELHA